MTIEEIKELIQVLQSTGIAELEVQRGDNRVRIRRGMANSQEVVVPTMLPMTMNAATHAAMLQSAATVVEPAAANSPGSALTSAAGTDPVAGVNSNDRAVTSPIVGTYYDAPAPDAPPFVQVGDRVEPKQVLCIIESMKLMNEIEAETAGTVTAKFVENGRPVEYGEPLFTIRPH